MRIVPILKGARYSVTTILPRCLLASMCSNALPISSNANTLSIGSCSFRDSTARPDIPADFVEDVADFLDRAGAEGDADIVDAARGMQVEVEIGMGAAEPADIDDAALDLGRLEILARDRCPRPDRRSGRRLRRRWPSAPDRPSRDRWNPPRDRRRIPSAGRGASRRSRTRSRCFAPLSFAICIAIRPTPELAP